VVKVLEHLAADGGAHVVVARLVHAQGETVEDDHQHAQALEPSDQELRKIQLFTVLIHVSWIK